MLFYLNILIFSRLFDFLKKNNLKSLNLTTIHIFFAYWADFSEFNKN